MNFKNKQLTWNGEKLVTRFVKNTVAEMNNISPSLLSVGDSCFVVEGSEKYIYKDGAWESDGGVKMIPFAIPSTAWQPSGKFVGFVFQADIPIDGLTENDCAQMILDANSVYLANKAFVMSGADVIDDVVRIYSKKKIEETLNGYCQITKVAT